jgi:CRP-like cAMP-binding protein
MARSEFERRLRTLRAEAETQLRHLEKHGNSLRKLIEFADDQLSDRSQTKPGSRPGSRSRRPSLTGTIRKRPGVRASMLADLLGVSFEQVSLDLEKLEKEGVIRRDGLGWRYEGP